jgi:hypothetical protein
MSCREIIGALTGGLLGRIFAACEVVLADSDPASVSQRRGRVMATLAHADQNQGPRQ